MPSLWSKLDHSLAEIYQDYLSEKELGAPPRVRFCWQVPENGRIAVSMLHDGDRAAIEALGFETRSWSGDGTAGGEIDLANLERLAAHPGVLRLLSGGRPRLTLDKSVPDIGADKVWKREANFPGYNGAGVVIGILDSGIDFRHPWFRLSDTPLKTRILRIWDQTLDAGEAHRPKAELLRETATDPLPASYGVEYTDDDINKTLEYDQKLEEWRKTNSRDNEPAPPAFPVLHTDRIGHGTQVAAVAAGDGRAGAGPKAFRFVGVAPRAELVIVNNPMPSTVARVGPLERLKHAVNYIINVAGTKPVVINASYTEESNPHDGKTAEEVWLNRRFANAPRRAFVAGAGNAAGEVKVRNEKVKANVHAKVTFRRNERVVIPVELFAPSADTARRDAARIIVYYPPGPELDFKIRSGDRPAYKLNVQAPRFRGSVLNQPFPKPTPESPQPAWKYGFIHDSNDASNCRFVLFMVSADSHGAYPAGRYELDLALNADGVGHIYCSDSRESGSNDAYTGSFRIDNSGSSFPGNVDVRERFLIGSPAGAVNVITVAAYEVAGASHPTHPRSSRGPLVAFDGRPETSPELQKPDIAAPGSHVLPDATHAGITTAASRDKRGWTRVWQTESGAGTSIAAPHVAGTIALMFNKNSSLTSDDVKRILMANVRREGTPNREEVGAGLLNAEKAVNPGP